MKIEERVARNFVEACFEDSENWKLAKVEKTLNALDQFSDQMTQPTGDNLTTFHQVSVALEEGQSIQVLPDTKEKNVSEKTKEKKNGKAKEQAVEKPEKPKKEKVNPEKEEKVKKPKVDKDEDNHKEPKESKRDFLGCQLDKPPAIINSVLTDDPQSAEDIAKKSKQPLPKVKIHLAYWVKRGTVLKKTEDGLYYVDRS